MSLAVLALTGRIDAIKLNQEIEEERTVDGDLEEDNGDDYMEQSIAEAEKEVKEKKGLNSSLDMHQEIKQLEEDSEVKGSKMSEDADVNQRKKINKMADDMTADALESKSILEWNGRDMNVKTNEIEQQHKDFLGMNKQAIHAAYEDLNQELTGKSSEKKEEKEQKKEEKSSEPKKAEEKEQKKEDKKEEAENESESESEGEGDDNKTKKKKKGKKSKKGKKKKDKHPQTTTTNNSTAQMNSTSQANTSTSTNNTKNATAPVKIEVAANATKDDMKKKYSLADEFVKEYTSESKDKEQKKEAPKE